MSSDVFSFYFFISLFHKFIYQWSTTKYYRTGLRFHETYFYAWDEQQETLWAAQSLNMKIADFGYLGINLSSLKQY